MIYNLIIIFIHNKYVHLFIFLDLWKVQLKTLKGCPTMKTLYYLIQIYVQQTNLNMFIAIVG